MKITWITYHSVEQRNGQYVSNLASVRYRVLIPARALSKLGYKINLLQIEPGAHVEDIVPRASGDVVIIPKLLTPDPELFEKLATVTMEIVRSVHAAGRMVVADICDDHFSRPLVGDYFRTLVKEADRVVASTPKMAEIVRDYTHRPVVVVGDPFEGAKGFVEFRPPAARARSLLGRVVQNITGNRRPLRLVWFGHGSNLSAVIDLLPDLSRLAADYVTEIRLVTAPYLGMERLCREFNENCAPACTLYLLPWSVETTWQALRDCDIVFIPVTMNDPGKLVKSPNRLVEAVWAGRFVVANPIPSYQEFGEFVWLGGSIVDGIKWALDHPELVRRKIAAGQEYISRNFSPDVIAQRWTTALLPNYVG